MPTRPMKMLCTHPGRYGDILWALPTVRAISRSIEAPVDLLLSPLYSAPSFRWLLQVQPYIGTVSVDPDWPILETAPMTPREPGTIPEGYDQVVHLAYDGWPTYTLPYEIYDLAREQLDALSWPLDLDTPWLAVPYTLPATTLVVGFSDEHFELKFGIYQLLRQQFCTIDNLGESVIVNVSGGPRWIAARQLQTDWESAASWIGAAQVFVGCCSALHVLACALGTPAIILMEPSPARQHDIFYPYGKGGRVQLVLGVDGLPTFDSRHVIEAVVAALDAPAAAPDPAPIEVPR